MSSSINKNKDLFLTLFMALAGVIMTIIPSVLIVYFIALNIYYIYKYSKSKEIIYLVLLLFFMPSIEILRRILGLDLMPYEFGKYMGVFYFFLLTLDKSIHKRRINSIFILLFIFLFPSILFMDLENFQRKITFNLLGIMNLALLGLVFSRMSIHLTDCKRVFRVFVFSLVPIMLVLFIKTPSFDELEFNLVANAKASGGFGPNQVSTVFGAGVLILMLSMFLFKEPLISSYNWLNSALLIGFAFRAIITFSRGGVLAPILSFVLPLLLIRNISNSRKVINRFVGITLFLMFSFFVVNEISGGFLSLRYQGETGQTMAGRGEANLNTLTAGRSNIIINDIQMWFDNFIFGVGPGESAEIRRSDPYYNGNPISHTEFSRLLSEHGLFGLLVNILIVISIPLQLLRFKSAPSIRYLKFCFVIFALASMAHSSMRTMIPFLFYAFSTVNIYDDQKSTLPR